MKKTWIYGLLPVMCIALAGCGKGKEPEGQVVATVNGDEITLTQLRAELAGVQLPDAKARKAAEQQALRALVSRKIVAQEAEKQKLDKTPAFALQQQRAEEAMLANALQKKVVDSVGEPSSDEVTRFISANPNLFAQRKIFVVDQLRVPRPNDPSILKVLEPLKTLEEVEGALRAKNIPFQRASDNIDAIGNDPRLVDAIVKLPPNEVFVVPSGRLIFINRVQETRVVPFAGADATSYATNMLKAQRTQEAVTKQIEGIIKAGEANVKYNKQYEPPAKTAKPAPKA